MTRRQTAKKASTLTGDKGRIERHIKSLLGAFKVAAVTRVDIERFRDDVTEGADIGAHQDRQARAGAGDGRAWHGDAGNGISWRGLLFRGSSWIEARQSGSWRRPVTPTSNASGA